jgi:Xaa-Pro aminopeptidase
MFCKTQVEIAMHKRLSELRNALEEKSLGALIITKIENVRYLSGFTGSSAVAIVTMDGAFLITDGRYREQACIEASQWETVVYMEDLTKSISSLLEGVESIGFEATASFEFVERLRQVFPGRSTLQSTKGIVEELRERKDEQEISLMRQALECAVEAFSETLPLVKPGTTEREIAAELDYRMMLAGAEGPAFDAVVASGPNSSLPHAGITDRVLAEGDLVVIDLGARKNGYCTDTSRTIVLGKPDRRQQALFETVKEAGDAALSVLKAGLPASEADGTARKVIADRGFADSFSHGLGHGVGLEVHEKPALSSLSKDVLQPGMVFTVEPGIYIEGWGGVRLEEMVLMTPSGVEVLSRAIPGR